MDDTLWPVHGLLRFLRSPSWWLLPMAAVAIGGLVLLGVLVGVSWWRWPPQEVAGWRYWLAALLAIGQGGAALLAAWVLVLPLLLGTAMESLARRVQRAEGAPETPELTLSRSLAASLRVVAGTLLPRLGWLGAGVLLSWVGGPIGVVVGAIAMAFIACLDAADLALSVRGLNGLQRLAALKAHRGELWRGAAVAGLLNLALAATVVGWVLWLPALVVGAARLVLNWPEATIVPPPPAIATVATEERQD
jgi:hypothetical protein